MITLVLPFPAIDPIVIEIGPFAIRWYSLAYITGLILGWRYMKRLVANRSLWRDDPPATPHHVDDLLLWITLGVILGGRLGYVAFYNPAFYAAHPSEILAVWRGGMSFHGGLAGVTVAVWLYCLRHKTSMFSMLDMAAASVPIGLFFGRIANFINGELYGRLTDVPWGVVFPGAGAGPRHPSQIYESVLEGAVLFAILRLATHHANSLKRPGLTAGIFLLGYGIARTLAEFFRMPDAHIGFLAGGLTMGMALSLPLALIGLGLIVHARRTGPPPT